jgi:hypothetical protein
MAVGAVEALTLGKPDGERGDPGQDLLIASQQVVFTEKDVLVAAAPAITALLTYPPAAMERAKACTLGR